MVSQVYALEYTEDVKCHRDWTFAGGESLTLCQIYPLQHIEDVKRHEDWTCSDGELLKLSQNRRRTLVQLLKFSAKDKNECVTSSRI